MARNVLLPTDGSPAAKLARAHAFEYARRYDGQVYAVHVVDRSLATSQPTRDALERRGEDVLDAVWGAGADRGFEVETDLLEGTPHEEILAYVRERPIDTVVMGSHGRSGLGRIVLGSTAERVIRLADVPVLTVRGADGRSPPTDYGSVVFPTDGSDAAAAALETAADLARTYDATLHVVHATGTERLGPDVRSRAILEEMQRVGGAAVADAADRARDAGVENVVTEVRDGSPTGAVVDYADEVDAGCIAMSTHGRTGLARYLLGSTTEHVLRTASRPVLAIPDTDADEA